MKIFYFLIKMIQTKKFSSFLFFVSCHHIWRKISHNFEIKFLMLVKSIESKKIEYVQVRNFSKKVSTDENFLFFDKNDTNKKIFNFFVLCIMALYLAQNFAQL